MNSRSTDHHHPIPSDTDGEAERHAIALWNDGRVEEAVAVLESALAAQRGNGPPAYPPMSPLASPLASVAGNPGYGGRIARSLSARSGRSAAFLLIGALLVLAGGVWAVTAVMERPAGGPAAPPIAASADALSVPVPAVTPAEAGADAADIPAAAMPEDAAAFALDPGASEADAEAPPPDETLEDVPATDLPPEALEQVPPDADVTTADPVGESLARRRAEAEAYAARRRAEAGRPGAR